MQFNRKHIVDSMQRVLSQGISPRKLALTCALGVVLGIFPVWGVSTWMCLGLAIMLRLNVIIIQLVNYLFFPLQLALILPFIKFGTWIFDLKPFPYDSAELMTMFQADFLLVLKEAGLSLTVGIGIWAVLAIPLFFIIFFLGHFVFSRWNRRLI